MKVLCRRVEQTLKCLWALLHLLHFHMAASQITCNCTAFFCIWPCLLLHQPVYWYGVDIGIWAQRISHVSEDGTRWFFIKDIWSLFCRLPCVKPCISGMISGTHIIALLPYCYYWLFFPHHRFPCSTNVSNASIYVRENENVFIFFRFFGYMHSYTKNGVDCPFTFCALLFDLTSFQD